MQCHTFLQPPRSSRIPIAHQQHLKPGEPCWPQRTLVLSLHRIKCAAHNGVLQHACNYAQSTCYLQVNHASVVAGQRTYKASWNRYEVALVLQICAAAAATEPASAPTTATTTAKAGSAHGVTTAASPKLVMQGTPLKSAKLSSHYDAVVIGSGIGGLAAAVALSKFAGEHQA